MLSHALSYVYTMCMKIVYHPNIKFFYLTSWESTYVRGTVPKV